MGSKLTNEELMTGYETRVFKGWKKTVADELKDSKMFEYTLKKAMGHEIEYKLPSGEEINIPIRDAIILAKLGFDLSHPEKIDLKVYSAVLGETKQELGLSDETASMVFKGIQAKGAKPNGSDTGSLQ